MFLKEANQTQVLEREEQWLYIKEQQSARLYKMVNSIQAGSVSNLYYELEILKMLQSKYTLKPLHIEQQEMKHLLLFAYDESTSLNQYMTKPLSVPTFLKIALEMANIFIDLHHSSIVYRNIHRKNFLINKKTNEIKLINFEHAYKFYRETLYQPEEQSHLLYRSHYFAPEETGRLNDAIDYRTDLYSLGVLFYELLTGTLPFATKETSQLFYEIMTRQPVTVKELNPNIPEPISAIIEKLLHKSKTERYQSAIGLKEDLLYCWHLFMNNEPIVSFELGKHDGPMFTGLHSVIPSRQAIVQSMMHYFQSQDEKQNQVIFLECHTGSGKTEVLNQLKNEWVQQKVKLVEVTMEPTMQQGNLAPIIHTVRSQLKHIYMEGPVRIDEIRLLFEQKGIIFYNEVFQLIPELEWFISAHLREAVTTVQQYPIDFHAFFNQIIQDILLLLLKNDKHLAVIVDQVDFIDASSLQCLMTIYEQLKSVRFVITYNQMTESVRTCQQFIQTYDDVHLQPLTLDEITEWLMYSLKEQSDNINRLANLLYDLTKGNPLFIQELFQTFMDMQLVYYSVQHSCWKMDLQKMSDMKISDNLVEFFTSRIEELTRAQQELLKVAACIGTTFDLAILASFVQIPRHELMETLHALIHAGCIVPLNERLLLATTFEQPQMLKEPPLYFRFVHVEIQQVLYSDISSEEYEQINYRLAHILANLFGEQMTDDELLQVMQHYNRSLTLLRKEEKIKVAKWNLRVAGSVMYKGLFQSATRFLAIAEELVKEGYLEEERAFLVELWRTIGVSQYMNGFYEEAEAYFDQGLDYATTDIEKLVIYNEKILFYSALSSDGQLDHNLQKALVAATEGLRLFQIEIRKGVSNTAVLKEYGLLQFALHKQPVTQLLDLKRNEDEVVDLILRVLLNISGTALVLDEKLFAWITLRAMRLLLKHGDVEFAAVIYSNYAALLITGFQEIKQAHQFGSLAIQHVERENKYVYKMNVFLNYGVNVAIWHRPYIHSVYYLKRSLHFCLNSKLHDLFAAISVSHMLHTILAQNKPLQELLQELEEHEHYVNRTKHTSPVDLVHEMKEWVYVLRSHTKVLNWHLPIANQHDVSNWENQMTIRLQMSYLFQEEQVVADLLEQTEGKIGDRVMTVSKPQYLFYRALWMIQCIRNQTVSQQMQRTYYQQIRKTLKKFQSYSEHAPENFEHLLYLLKAEYSHQQHQIQEAKLFYDRAMQLASLHDFFCDLAIANRCAALFYEAIGERYLAEEYMHQAIEHVNDWGAERLAAHWEQRYMHLLHNQSFSRKKEVLLPFDMQTVIEINQILSRETKMDELIEKALHLMMKHTDANHSYFFKCEHGTMQFVAKAALHQGAFTLVQDVAEQQESQSLQAIRQYVLTSKQHVLIDNTDLPSSFQFGALEKSILCLPIFYQGQVTAILYLANTMTPYVFTSDKIELLKMISAQVAISIEHTKVYERLEEQVADRTGKLHELNSDLNEMNERLQQNESERKLFMQNVAHDLRSPITSVLGYIDAILDGVVEEPAQQQFHLMRSRERLLSLNYLIQDLFDLSQLEAGRTQFDVQLWSTAELFTIFDAKFALDVEQAGLRYTSAYHIDDDHYVTLDLERIGQVLTNLFSNAIKYTVEGTIHFSMKIEDKQWICSIEDSGIGIPEKELPFIFDMHYRASNNTVSSANSNGIGLAICKQIMMRQQGGIFVESKEGIGSVFHVVMGVDEGDDVDV